MSVSINETLLTYRSCSDGKSEAWLVSKLWKEGGGKRAFDSREVVSKCLENKRGLEEAFGVLQNIHIITVSSSYQ